MADFLFIALPNNLTLCYNSKRRGAKRELAAVCSAIAVFYFSMIQRVKQFSHNTFASLKVRNYRLYFIGQGISITGTWMQTIGQSWLVLELTGSGTALGLVTALQFLPILFLAPMGGVMADRFSKRKILFFTQSFAGLLALALGLLVATHVVELWMVFVLAGLLGLNNAIDNPTRQSFIFEMVGHNDISNAVTLNSTEVNLGRIIGPAIAGIIIATIGIALCFFINAVSYVAVLICLAMMNAEELYVGEAIKRAKGQVREGFRYVLATPLLRDLLIMLAIVGTFVYEFQVSLALMARYAFHGDAAAYALLTSAMGLGSVIGGLATAGRRKTNPQAITKMVIILGIAVILAALAPTLWLAALAMVFVGFASINFTSLGNSTLQLESAPHMRSRVMALWSVAFLGSTPIGGPVVGWIGEHVDPRWGLGIGGIAAIVAGVFGMMVMKNHSEQRAPEDVVSDELSINQTSK